MAIWDEQRFVDAYGWIGGFPHKPGFGIEDLSYLDGRMFALQLADDDVGGLSEFRHRLQRLGATGTFTPSANTIVVGCGFGWLIELIVDAGSNAVWGTDTSPAIQTRITDPGVDVRLDVQPLILDINILDADAIDQFLAAGVGSNKGEFRNVVTEYLVDDIPVGPEMTTMLDACDALLQVGQSNVFHIVTAADCLLVEQTDPAFLPNFLTLAEWVALRPSHFWIDGVTGNVGGGA